MKVTDIRELIWSSNYGANISGNSTNQVPEYYTGNIQENVFHKFTIGKNINILKRDLERNDREYTQFFSTGVENRYLFSLQI